MNIRFFFFLLTLASTSASFAADSTPTRVQIAEALECPHGLPALLHIEKVKKSDMSKTAIAITSPNGNKEYIQGTCIVGESCAKGFWYDSQTKACFSSTFTNK